MFNEAFIISESRARVTGWALPLSLAVHAVFADVLIAAPLLQPGIPPRIEVRRAFFTPAMTVSLPFPPLPDGKAEKYGIDRLSPARFLPVEGPSGFEDGQNACLKGVVGGVSGCVDPGNVLAAAAGIVLAPGCPVCSGKRRRSIRGISPIYADITPESGSEGRFAGFRPQWSTPRLDEAVRPWAVEPMIVNGRPVGVMFTVRVRPRKERRDSA